MASHALRLMAVLAHPDDESLGVGGTLARYAAEGVEIHLVTATRGESGRFRGHREGPEHPGREALAAIRERELRAAARVLGVGELHFLGYGDGAVDQAPASEAVGRIVRHLRTARPHVVLSFGPEGGYGHPDHIAISQFATAATVAAADPSFAGAPDLAPHAVSKFYYMAWPEGPWLAYQEAFRKLTATVDGIERQALPWPDWQVTTVLDTRAHWETVWKAVSCHDSQIAAYERLKTLSPARHEALWGWQSFYRVFSTVNGGRRIERDLFEGLRGDAHPAPGSG